ncbi:MAG: twin-arginine translocation signal domain-containing protein, partial [Pseudomonadota bacterium]
MPTSRRDFIKALGAGAFASTALTTMPSTFTAHAADTNGYKALVCVFLF